MSVDKKNFISHIASYQKCDITYTWLSANRISSHHNNLFGSMLHRGNYSTYASITCYMHSCASLLSSRRVAPGKYENMKQIDPKKLMTQVVQQLDAAFAYVCRSKQKAHHNQNILISCKTRYVLRKIIKQVYGIWDKLTLKLAYSKTYIGKAQKGFYFLRYTIEAGTHSVSLSKTSLQRFCKRLQRLYEQRAFKARVAAYVNHWCRWAKSGLRDLNIKIPSHILTLIHNPDDLKGKVWLAE